MIDRARIKRSVPSALHGLIGALLTYIRRLQIWLRIVVAMRGAGLQDQIVLLGSFLAAPFTALPGLGKWRDPYLLRDAIVIVFSVGTFRCRGGTDDLWHVLPKREPAVFDAIASSLRPKDCFVDAGANIGIYTILAAKKVGVAGRVVSIEMMPDTAQILRDHVQANQASSVTVVERALTDQVDQITTAYVSDGKAGQASISSSTRHDGKRAVVVSTTTLDELLRDIGGVRLMKMDLEGAEELALRGASESIRRIEVIIFESHEGEGIVMQFLRKQGFSIRRLDGRNMLATRAPGL